MNGCVPAGRVPVLDACTACVRREPHHMVARPQQRAHGQVDTCRGKNTAGHAPAHAGVGAATAANACCPRATSGLRRSHRCPRTFLRRTDQHLVGADLVVQAGNLCPERLRTCTQRQPVWRQHALARASDAHACFLGARQRARVHARRSPEGHVSQCTLGAGLSTCAARRVTAPSPPRNVPVTGRRRPEVMRVEQPARTICV